MVPYLDLIMPGILVAERYLYFSVFCILLGPSLAAVVLRRANPASRLLFYSRRGFFGVNLFQKLSYQTAWRNGETLWQYHLTLPQPATGAYENLAGYYYANFTSAFVQKNTPLMVSSIRKMATVVDAGLAEFWLTAASRRRRKPIIFYFSIFVQEVNDEPEAALSSLLTADRLRPGFDAINLNLARLYRELAGGLPRFPAAANVSARCARPVRQNISVEFPGRPAPPEFRKEMADIEAEYSAVTNSSSDKETKPAEKKPLPQ